MKKYNHMRTGTAAALLAAVVLNTQMTVYADDMTNAWTMQEISLEELKNIGETTKEFELFDKDGDGIWETLRLFDGYETSTPGIYDPVWNEETGKMTTEMTYDWRMVEHYLDIARKYPGELALFEEYRDKQMELFSELQKAKNSMQEILLAECLNISS